MKTVLSIQGVCILKSDTMKMFSLLIMLCCMKGVVAQKTNNTATKNIALVIHGGAGTILKEKMTEESERGYKQSLEEALQRGYAILNKGGSAIDAVEACVRMLEDNPLFNAGKGSVFTHEGKIELDAAIMDGRNQAAGAVAGITNIKNPISAARVVMEK